MVQRTLPTTAHRQVSMNSGRRIAKGIALVGTAFVTTNIYGCGGTPATKPLTTDVKPLTTDAKALTTDQLNCANFLRTLNAGFKLETGNQVTSAANIAIINATPKTDLTVAMNGINFSKVQNSGMSVFTGNKDLGEEVFFGITNPDSFADTNKYLLAAVNARLGIRVLEGVAKHCPDIVGEDQVARMTNIAGLTQKAIKTNFPEFPIDNDHEVNIAVLTPERGKVISVRGVTPDPLIPKSVREEIK
ncbi:MAG: hypothetical protein SFU25_06305 [Candidatus Caenarcaniphilales bacterium]|nr:hypothetical protein [Candidatus Caenarcaniphilales bacterium]